MKSKDKDGRERKGQRTNNNSIQAQIQTKHSLIGNKLPTDVATYATILNNKITKTTEQDKK